MTGSSTAVLLHERIERFTMPVSRAPSEELIGIDTSGLARYGSYNSERLTRFDDSEENKLSGRGHKYTRLLDDCDLDNPGVTRKTSKKRRSRHKPIQTGYDPTAKGNMGTFWIDGDLPDVMAAVDEAIIVWAEGEGAKGHELVKETERGLTPAHYNMPTRSRTVVSRATRTLPTVNEMDPDIRHLVISTKHLRKGSHQVSSSPPVNMDIPQYRYQPKVPTQHATEPCGPSKYIPSSTIKLQKTPTPFTPSSNTLRMAAKASPHAITTTDNTARQVSHSSEFCDRPDSILDLQALLDDWPMPPPCTSSTNDLYNFSEAMRVSNSRGLHRAGEDTDSDTDDSSPTPPGQTWEATVPIMLDSNAPRWPPPGPPPPIPPRAQSFSRPPKDKNPIQPPQPLIIQKPRKKAAAAICKYPLPPRPTTSHLVITTTSNTQPPPRPTLKPLPRPPEKTYAEKNARSLISPFEDMHPPSSPVPPTPILPTEVSDPSNLPIGVLPDADAEFVCNATQRLSAPPTPSVSTRTLSDLTTLTGSSSMASIRSNASTMVEGPMLSEREVKRLKKEGEKAKKKEERRKEQEMLATGMWSFVDDTKPKARDKWVKKISEGEGENRRSILGMLGLSASSKRSLRGEEVAEII